MTNDQTLIIGAGAAGLAAASLLVAENKPFLILEARDRIGGRVHTIHDEHWPLPLEFGAEFIHGRPAESWDIVHRAGLRAYDVANDHWMSKGAKPVKGNNAWEGMQQIMQRLSRVPKQDATFMDFMREHCADLPQPARDMAKALVEGLDAADAEIVSALSIKNSDDDGDTFDADTPFRLFDGYDRFIQALAAAVPKESIHLNSIIRSIHWAPGQVRVQTADGKTFQGKAAIITLPIGVLRAQPGQTGAVEFEPALPHQARSAIDHMRMGPVVKVLLRFRRSFWEDGPWRDMAFVHSPGDVFPTWWTMLPCRVPMLTAWAGGPAAAAMSNRPPAQVLDDALATLSRLLGVEEQTLHADVAAWHISDWQADPFSRGAYAFATVEGSDAAKQLSEPIEQTLFFAGEATHPGYSGTVAAAIASGYRAARQLT